VITCDAKRLVVRFEGTQIDAIAARWRDSMVAAGWLVARDVSEAGLPAYQFAHGEQKAVFGIVVTGDVTLATVARAP
jgi:hypothetical protein